MKHLLITLAILTIVSSCATQKRCSIKFPPQVVTITKDSIREIVTYRDTTIYIKLPGTIVTVTDTVYIKNGVIIFKEVKASSNYADARAWMGQNRINLELKDKDTTLELRLKNAIKTAEYWKSKYTTETKVSPPEKYIPKWVKILAWIGAIGLLLAGLWVYKKIRF